MFSSIDVIIPSFRLNKETLLPLLNLKRPENIQISFYLVADNPALIPDPAIQALVDNEHVHLLINEQNLGASSTRNRGINAGKGAWILFLDDDITVPDNLLEVYAGAITEFPNEIGFIGRVLMPPPCNLFTESVEASGSMSIFNISAEKEYFAWGATANVMIRRSALKEVRFSDQYPKWGGGEEVEFFLRMRAANGYKDFKTLKEAAVTHPWWNDGKTNFSRFYRYGQGNSFLAERNPTYAWYDFTNTPETILLLLVILPFTLFAGAKAFLYTLCFILLTVFIEYIVTILRVKRNTHKTQPVTAVYVSILRIVYETGLLKGNLGRGRLKGFGERFSYDGSLKKNHFRLNRFKIIKLVLYIMVFAILLYCYYASR